MRRMTTLIAAVLLSTSMWPVLGFSTAAAADPTRGDLGLKATSQTLVGSASSVPEAGFQDTTVFSGLTAPTAIRFSPDGRVFVAEKSGIIRVFASLTATTSTVFADLSREVDNYWDRGLLGLALDPGFPTTPYVYVLYTYDAPIGGTPPAWNDACPSPPGPTTDGCVVSGRLSRLQAAGNLMTGAEQPLINDWCQQFPSHSIGDLQFGPDGALYVSAGDGAGFGTPDYGQYGGSAGSPTPLNPCGDPPGGVGGSMTPPTAEGGALRSQSARRPSTQPVVLNGSILRVDPATGNALPDNPLSGSSSANARRLVGYGFRNPFRFTFRPGTSELWIGDVGYNTWEEVDRITSPTASPVLNGGWPCYEGLSQQSAYAAVGLDQCSTLYSAPTGLLTPYFSYNHSSAIVAGEACPTANGSVISGIAFYTGGTYPAAYNGAMFFADHSRNCIWAMRTGSNGLPDPTKIETFISGAANPVAVQIGPGGDLFYVDFDGGTIHRVVYNAADQPPVAVISQSATGGPSPLTVNFDASQSSDPDPGDTLTYSWDLDGNGTFGDSTAVSPSFTYTSLGIYTVGLRVTDSHGLSSNATVSINVDNASPTVTIDSPSPSLTWAVGDAIAFSGHATDHTGAALPASALTWTLLIHHCTAVGSCHIHDIQTFVGASGSFSAPDHPYPTYLELQLTATDSAGRNATASVALQPKTVDLTMASVPTGLSLIVSGNDPVTTPFTTTVIVNSAQSLIAPETQIVGSTTYVFSDWSDGGAATHGIVVGSTGATYTATYTAQTGTTSYLSDLAYSAVANGWGPVEKDTSNGEQAAGDGLPITLNGVVYAKGLGTHAASDVRYTLAGTCSLFTATVGVDDEVGANGSVVFQVFTDGTKVYDSGVLTGSSPSAAVSLDVTGKTALQLVVTNGGDNIDFDHADWADASLTCGSTNSGGAPSFAPAVSLPAAIHTHGVAMVDLNADGKLDLVAANAGSSTASVWLGNGNGTFGARADFPTGLTPKMVAVGDLNGDGKKDLVSANQDAATVSVLLGNGAGGFAAKVDYAACTGTHEVALGDLNGDGALDIIAACWGGSVVSVLLGNGDGTLRPKVDYGAGAAPHSVVLGRFDGDAFLDAAVANHDSNTVSILRGNGDGTFQAQITYAVGTGPHSLRSGDLNGDGSLDLVTANETSSDVSVLLGNGNGTFETAVNYPTGSVPKGVAIADVSGDGRADVITADTAGSYPVCCNPGGNLISVLLGSGAGTLGAPIPFTVGQTPFAVATGDLDGDGDLDVATANWDSGDVTVLKNLTTASADTTPPTVTGTSPANGATGVATSITPSATFSEAIDPTTVSTTTMTLTNQATSAAVAGSVAYNGTSHTATFSPSAALAAGTTYLARLKGGSSGVKDLAGNALAADATWTFTTAAGVAASQVRIETAANGTGTVVPAQSLAVGSAITGYAISRDSTGGFIANVPASWSLTALSGGVVGTDLVVAGDAKSATFTGHAAGSAIIHPVVSGLTSVEFGDDQRDRGQHHQLPVRPRLLGRGQRLGSGREGHQQRRAGRRRRAADHLERGRLRQGPGHPRRVGRALHAGRHVQPVHGHGRRR